MPNFSQTKILVQSWFQRLIQSKVPEPHLSLRYFIEDVLSVNLANINIPKDVGQLIINDCQADKIEKFVFRREHHEPIQYIIGNWPFRSLSLKMKSPVFIPRPETEKLIDIVRRHVTTSTRNALEIGVGTGAICLSLLKETEMCIFGIDQSKDAVELTNANLHNNKLDRLKIKISQINLTDCFDENLVNISRFLNCKCDILISNPPYIPRRQLFTLERQVQYYESTDALDGGLDGLDVVRRILGISKFALNDGGLIFLELDETHPELFRGGLLEQFPGLKLLEICDDIYQRPRFVVLNYKSAAAKL